MHSLLRWFQVLVGSAAALGAWPAAAGQLTLERLFADPGLDGPKPRNVQIAPDGSRVGLLRGKLDDQYQLDLWAYDVRANQLRLLVDSRELAADATLSDAEKARRERERTAAYHGIADYQWSPDGQQLLFPLADKLYLYDLRKPPGQALRLLLQQADVIDPQISPRGHYVSYVWQQNLYVIELATGQVRQLTQDGGGAIHNAEAEFIAQEEMDRSQGYWWAPDDSQLAFERYDESQVAEVQRFEVYADHTEVVRQRYPRAGAANVRVQLGLLVPQGGATRWLDLGADPDIYLARVNWLPDASALAFQVQSRDQKHLDLRWAAAGTLQQRSLLTESSSTWINLNDDLHFLKRSARFLWASERSGFKQLYLYGLDGQLVRMLGTTGWRIDAVLAVDEKHGLVYFTSNRDDALEQQIYTLRLDGRDGGQPRRISQEPGWHAAVFPRQADDLQLYVDSYSSPDTPPNVSVRGPDGRRLAWLEANALDQSHPYWSYRDSHVVPEYGVLKAADGQELHYSLLKPPHFDATRRYPAILYTYGGPTVQVVQKRWPALYHEYLAQQGYLVFSIDNRGSDRRSRAFSDPIYRQLGEVEAQDQLTGVAWLKQQSFVDPKAIGVFGWSYGGYMSVNLLTRASSEFAAGVAVAPVTDWSLYDTHYTERYLQRPRDNAEGYAQSGVFARLAGLTAPLLLVHGMADDNVLFSNSTQLMAALQAQGTQFELMTYPGGKHGLSTPAMQRHAYRAITEFFDQHLKGAGAAPAQ
ncbi:MAG: S9 family peptidase [Steroidobacteraceae bacterium]